MSKVQIFLFWIEVEHHNPEGQEAGSLEEDDKMNNEEQETNIDQYSKIIKAIAESQKEPKQLEEKYKAKKAEIQGKLNEKQKENLGKPKENAFSLELQQELLNIPFETMIETVTDPDSKNLWQSMREEYNAITKELITAIMNAPLNNKQESPKSNPEVNKGNFEEEKKELIQKIASLEKENKKCFETIVKHSKALCTTPSIPKKEPQNNLNEQQDKSVSSPTEKKSLTLKQLKDLIVDIYEQKQFFDEKCTSNKLPKETMEQYLYTYLNKKYGLKNIVMEWASSVINGIKRYSFEDSDVALFARIMRNECDEGFRFVHGEVKTAMLDILKECLRKKMKLKPDKEIEKAANELQNGEIEEWQWMEVIKKMYNEEHCEILEQRIRDKSEVYRNSPQKIQPGKFSREAGIKKQENKGESLPFVEFQKVRN